MRIAVDARPLASPVNGIGRYTHCLLKRMVQSDHEWFLYSDRPIHGEAFKNQPVTIRCGDARGGTPGSLKWAQWQYLRWAQHDKVALFWSPRHHLPLMLNRRIRTVVTIHDLVWRRYPETMQPKNRWLERLLTRPSIASADSIICVSDFTAGEVEAYYPEHANKCRVIHEAAEAHEPGALPGDVPERYLLFVGTLEPRKNLDNLLSAYSSLGSSQRRPPLIIVGGSGWGDYDVRAHVAKLDLTSQVIFYGQPADDELHALYKNALALVMPSLYEGFGLPALEAMQHGVPVIASNNSSLPEIVGDAGLLVDPRSIEAIARAMQKISGDDSLRALLSERAIVRSQRFSWDLAASQTMEVFNDLAG